MKIEWATERLETGLKILPGFVEFHDTWCYMREGAKGSFIEYDTVNALEHYDGHWLQWRCLGCSYTNICIPEAILEQIFDELIRRVLASHEK